MQKNRVAYFKYVYNHIIFFFRDCKVCSRRYTSARGDSGHGEGLVRRPAAMESFEGKWTLCFVFDPPHAAPPVVGQLRFAPPLHTGLQPA